MNPKMCARLLALSFANAFEIVKLKLIINSCIRYNKYNCAFSFHIDKTGKDIYSYSLAYFSRWLIFDSKHIAISYYNCSSPNDSNKRLN